MANIGKVQISVWQPKNDAEAMEMIDEAQNLAADYLKDVNKVVLDKLAAIPETSENARERTKILYAYSMAATAWAAAGIGFQHPMIQAILASKASELAHSFHDFLMSRGGVHYNDVVEMMKTRAKS